MSLCRCFVVEKLIKIFNERALRIVYQDDISNLEELLQKYPNFSY